MRLDEKIHQIEADGRFALCQQYNNGLFETSIFYTPIFKGGSAERKELRSTISKSMSYAAACDKTIDLFKQWVIDNKIEDADYLTFI